MDWGGIEESLVQAPVLCLRSSVVLLMILLSLCDQGQKDRERDELRQDDPRRGDLGHVVEENQVKRSALEHWWKDLEEVLQQMALQTPAHCSPTSTDGEKSSEDTSRTCINNNTSGNFCEAGETVLCDIVVDRFLSSHLCPTFSSEDRHAL